MFRLQAGERCCFETAARRQIFRSCAPFNGRTADDSSIKVSGFVQRGAGEDTMSERSGLEEPRKLSGLLMLCNDEYLLYVVTVEPMRERLSSVQRTSRHVRLLEPLSLEYGI